MAHIWFRAADFLYRHPVLTRYCFSATGVIIFIFCKVMFQPIHDLAYFPTMMKTIDKVKGDREAE